MIDRQPRMIRPVHIRVGAVAHVENLLRRQLQQLAKPTEKGAARLVGLRRLRRQHHLRLDPRRRQRRTQMPLIRIARNRHPVAPRPQPGEHLGHLRVGRHRRHVIPEMLKSALRRNRVDRAALKSPREMARPGLRKRAERRLRPVHRPVARQPLRLRQRARGVQPRLPDLLARRVAHPVTQQHLVNQRREIALLQLQQRAVAVERHRPHRRRGPLRAHHRRRRRLRRRGLLCCLLHRVVALAHELRRASQRAASLA